ncbi:MAG TPA: hypothetical protein VFA69_09150 [Candidatus Nitrosotalea sp.]|nr:hypothetical protein [Candidatus Nitrosotalea sp.]
MKTLHYSIIAIMSFISVIMCSNLAYAQYPGVACGWVPAFAKYEFNQNDTIPITFHDPCYPQEGTTLVVTVSDGDSLKITGKYLNKTIIATNDTFTINFVKPANSTQYRFFVALANVDRVGADIFTKPNASQLVIDNPSVSHVADNPEQLLIHATLLDGLGNQVTPQKMGHAAINVELLIPQCDYGNKCGPNPVIDMEPSAFNQTSYGLIDIPKDLATGTYNLVFNAKSYYPGYQSATSVIMPIFVHDGKIDSTEDSARPATSDNIVTKIISLDDFKKTIASKYANTDDWQHVVTLRSLGWSQDNKTIIVKTDNNFTGPNLWALGMDGTGLHSILPNDAVTKDMRYPPNELGNMTVSVPSSTEVPSFDIVFGTKDNSYQQVLYAGDTGPELPAISSDGKHVVFAMDAFGTSDNKPQEDGIYVITLSTPIPEFSFAVPILLIGLVSVIVFYRIRNRR